MEDYEEADSPEPRRAGNAAAGDDAALPAVGAQLSDGQLSVLNDYDAPVDGGDNNGVVEAVDQHGGEPGSSPAQGAAAAAAAAAAGAGADAAAAAAAAAAATKKGGAPVPALLLRVVRAAAADAAWCESYLT